MKSIFWAFIMLCISVNVQAQSSTSNDQVIKVTIVHGSRPRLRYYGSEYLMLGGKLGGHVVIQLDTCFYGFNFRQPGWVHPLPFPRGYRNGIFEKEGITEWSFERANSRTTIVEIPVTDQQYAQLLDKYNSNLGRPPYDYAFFGMRCASSCYHMLSQIGVLKPCTRAQSIVKAFHPKALRAELLKVAKERDYRVTVIEGSRRRKWEGPGG
jgi:hypothetical protein